MAKSKESPKSRRKSIAVPTHKKPIQPRRRAHSIAPGDTVLSPRALARRVLVPRKSVLKSSINVGEASADDATQTLDFTRDYRSVAPRKSLGRRVSFAQHAYVKVFERDLRSPQSSSPVKDDGGQSPQDSPVQDSPKVNDENDYPGAKPIVRRRSSVRRSLGDNGDMTAYSDMDLEAEDAGAGPSQIFASSDDIGVGDYDDEVWDDDEEFDDEDMEITEAIANNIQRRRSSAARRRSSIAPPPPPDEQEDEQPQQAEQSYEEENSVQSQGEGNSLQSQSYASETSGDQSYEPMEYTVPLSQSIRGKRPPSDAFLALRAMTHANDNSFEEEPLSDDDADLYVRKDHWDGDDLEPDSKDVSGSEAMELTDALHRLKVARDSLGIGGAASGEGPADEFQEGSFTDSENSFEDMGNQTLNLTGLVRRASMGQVDIGMPANDELAQTEPLHVSPASAWEKENEHPKPAQEPTVDSTSTIPVFKPPTHGHIFSAPSPFKPSKSTSSTPTAPLTTPRPFVFSKPSQDSAEAEAGRPTDSETPAPVASAAKPAPRPPTSPGKSRLPQPTSASKPKFSAAFAPPSARKLPRARSIENLNDTLDPEDRPSPAKKLNLGSGKALPLFPAPSPARASPARTVGRLSPSKKAKFEKPTGADAEPDNRRKSVGLRRPPGYLAQRRSMGAPSAVADGDKNSAPGPSTDKKAALVRLGRASVGSAGNVSLGPFDPRAEATSNDEVEPAPPASPRVASPAPRGAARGPLSPAHSAGRAESPARASPVVGRVSPAPYVASIYPPLPEGRQGSPSLGRASPARATAPSLYPPLPSSSKDSSAHASPEEPTIVDVTYGEEEMAGNPTEAWVKNMQDAGSFDDEEEPPISIEQFFSLTGIKFMDELTVPRRSTFHRAGIQARNRRDSATSDTGEEPVIPLAEYVVAMTVDVPQLELYSHVAQDLQAWIEHSKANFKQAEAECAKVTPELFREYSRCSEEDRPDFQQSLKLIKSHAHDQAKSQWYEWKLQWVEQLQETADQGFADLEADAKVLESLTRQVQDLLPSLREEYEQAIRELEQEQAEVDELERSDQSYLNELKATIAEQDFALDSFRTEISESKAKLANLSEKLEEIEQQKKESMQAISDAERMAHVQKNSTKAEVFKLRDELDSIQNLHYWRPSKIQSDMIELIYDSRYLVSIPCTKFKPVRHEFSVTRLTDPSTRRRDDFSKLTEYSFKAGMHQVMTDQTIVNVRQIVHRMSDIWAACAQLRQQFTFLGVKFPTSVRIDLSGGDKPPGLIAVAAILYAGKRAKALVKFSFDADTFFRWPKSIDSLKCDVEVAYGPIESTPIQNAVRGRLAKATPADNHGCLLDACIEGSEQYD